MPEGIGQSTDFLGWAVPNWYYLIDTAPIIRVYL